MNKVFAIIGNLKREPSIFMMLGTGFFIDENGFFTTAGHVFRDNRDAIQEFHICFPKENKYVDIIPVTKYRFYSRKIYGDQERLMEVPRPRFNYQCGPEYFDVAVGKVDNQENNFLEFKVKRPFEGEKLTMPCYNINRQTCPENRFTLIDNKVNCQYIEIHNWDLRLRERLKLARIPFLYETMEFKNIDLYNNCIEVYGQGTKGNSGAPVLNNQDEIVGIYVAGTVFNDLRTVHLSRYVKKKAMKLKRIIKSDE